MPKREALSIKIDYLSAIFETIQAKEFIERIMELPLEIFHVQKTRIKHQPYTRLYQCGTIKIYGNVPPIETNPLGLGCYLVLSGKGCDDYFGRFGFRSDTDIYYDFFAKCKARLKNKFHLTRLDVAIDDKNAEPYFTIEQIKKKCLKEEFISKSRSYRFAESSFEDGETAKTVYIGDGKSNLSIRFYDKDKEVCGKYQIPWTYVNTLDTKSRTFLCNS